jgi:hypothetical protein
LIIILWAILPWLMPAYSHNLVLTVRFIKSDNPTYEINLRNPTPWPVKLLEAQWFVEHHGRYRIWVTSEPPRRELWLLPFQSHSFQFTIYNEYDNGRQYYSGPLTVDLRATLNVIGAVSQVSLITSYNVTSR